MQVARSIMPWGEPDSDFEKNNWRRIYITLEGSVKDVLRCLRGGGEASVCVIFNVINNLIFS